MSFGGTSKFGSVEVQNDLTVFGNIIGDTTFNSEVEFNGDVVINEIMFNPLTGGSDWVEVYNNSSKLIDLFNWEIANYETIRSTTIRL